MATSSKYTTDLYEYMDETKIDDSLKCTICIQPYQKPVSLSCQHTFCHQCIECWFKEQYRCPTCRQPPKNHDEKFSPVNTSIVNNQLDRLLVRCNVCKEINIQRGNFLDHKSKCLKKIVRCPSADIECQWKGRRDEQVIHLQKCPFQQIRPIIDLLRTQLDASLKIQNKTQEKLENQSERINFLLGFINQGRTMNKKCLSSHDKCQYAMNKETKSKITYNCTLCKNIIKRSHVSVHACSSKDHINCICKTCFAKQHTIPKDTDDDDDDTMMMTMTMMMMMMLTMTLMMIMMMTSS